MKEIQPTMFFSVDVETTHTDPISGMVLTIGIQPVIWLPNRPAIIDEHKSLYLRIDQTRWYSDWFTTLTDPNSTLSWWLRQDEAVQNEAFRDTTLPRCDEFTAVTQIASYVDNVANGITPKNRVFAANPVTFDRAWIDSLWTNVRFSKDATEIPPMPFHYRSLCLRSMAFALRMREGWDTWGRTNSPEMPHHALSDAQAQARDLKEMLDSTLSPEEVHQWVMSDE